MRRAWSGIGAGVLWALSACGGDDSAQVEQTGSGIDSESSSSSEGSTTQPDPSISTTTTTGENPGTTTGSTGEDTDSSVAELEYARGIRLVRMTANQGVQVELVRDGAQVEAAEYNTRLIAGRRTLIRGFWSLHATFEPRQLIGRLTVDYPDGTSLQQDFPLLVDGPSSDGGGAASFQWLLEPDQVVPGMRFRARILEPDPSLTTGEVSDPPPIAPLEGKGTLALYEAPLELRVVLVPVRHQFEGCDQTPQITEADVEAMRQQLEQNNPVQQAIFEVREPMVYNASIAEGGSFVPVLAALADLHMADDPDPNVYYYGLLDSCDGFPPGLLGQAIAIPEPPTLEGSQMRISTGRWLGSGEAAAETFVHEVGHTQGRRHVRCSGGEAGVDQNYPHLGGRIGVWGFGIYDFQLRAPTAGRDYMTYCSNEWVSDYGWEQTLDVIELMTSYDYQNVQPDREPMLMGLVDDKGYERWWVTSGGVPTPTPGDRLAIEVGEIPVEVPASVTAVPHDDAAYLVLAPLPAGAWPAKGLTLHRRDGTSRAIQASRVTDRLGSR